MAKVYNLTDKLKVEEVGIQIGDRVINVPQETEVMLDYMDIVAAAEVKLSGEIDKKDVKAMRERVQIATEFCYEELEAILKEDDVEYIKSLKLPLTKLQELVACVVEIINTGELKEEEGTSTDFQSKE